MARQRLACDIQCVFCGTPFRALRENLISGHTQSCGCLLQRGRPLIHGNSRVGKRTAEYRAWASAKDRCSNPKTKGYSRYGGKGIRMCMRWLTNFPVFLSDMGIRPSLAHSLDRIDGRLGYQPENCRWATRSQQAFNRIVWQTGAYVPR